MKKWLKKLSIIFFAAIFSSGCLYHSTRRLGGYEPSVRPLQENRKYEILGKSEAIASNYNLFWVFSVTPRPDLDRAIEEAIQQKKGHELIDVSWTNETEYWQVGTINILRVKGKVIKYTD